MRLQFALFATIFSLAAAVPIANIINDRFLATEETDENVSLEVPMNRVKNVFPMSSGNKLEVPKSDIEIADEKLRSTLAHLKSYIEASRVHAYFDAAAFQSSATKIKPEVSQCNDLVSQLSEGESKKQLVTRFFFVQDLFNAMKHKSMLLVELEKHASGPSYWLKEVYQMQIGLLRFFNVWGSPDNTIQGFKDIVADTIKQLAICRTEFKKFDVTPKEQDTFGRECGHLEERIKEMQNTEH
ncbi:hypothetical protein JCM33374_g1138 [Metschnikowia sp. JCM 33374]|nr:hypothetical protein JCM33374_g1138 [Metschnikowia sp. JCM 33374]